MDKIVFRRRRMRIELGFRSRQKLLDAINGQEWRSVVLALNQYLYQTRKYSDDETKSEMADDLLGFIRQETFDRGLILEPPERMDDEN